jgi:hypothetical protein
MGNDTILAVYRFKRIDKHTFRFPVTASYTVLIFMMIFRPDANMEKDRSISFFLPFIDQTSGIFRLYPKGRIVLISHEHKNHFVCISAAKGIGYIIIRHNGPGQETDFTERLQNLHVCAAPAGGNMFNRAFFIAQILFLRVWMTHCPK